MGHPLLMAATSDNAPTYFWGYGVYEQLLARQTFGKRRMGSSVQVKSTKSQMHGVSAGSRGQKRTAGVDHPLNGFAALLYRLATRAVVRKLETYHPVSIRGRQICGGERTCNDRWSLIRRELNASGAQTCIDLGCAEGYFVKHAASECGCVAVGVDADVRRLALAQTALALDPVEGVGFVYGHITPDLIRALPAYDAVLFMSILHHTMYEHGVEYSREIMRELRSKVGMFLIFDMGQSNEDACWAQWLPDMGADPHSWIKDFVHSAGYRTVDRIGYTDAYKNTVRRALFRAVP